jgi:hypothetical protein
MTSLAVQCALDLRRSNSTEDHYFYFGGHEEEVPPRSVDRSIKRTAIESFDHAPVDFTNHVTTGHCLLLESHERILFRCDGEKKEGLRSFLGQSSGLQC